MALPKYFTVHLPCKPYIKKYASHRFGSPLLCKTQNPVTNYLNACLVKERYTEHKYSKSFIHANYTASITFSVSGWVFSHVGFDFPTGKVIEINQFLENMFFEHLFEWCDVRYIPGKNERKALIEQFAERHGIDLIDDISLEALVKKERRMRDAIDRRIALSGKKFC